MSSSLHSSDEADDAGCSSGSPCPVTGLVPMCLSRGQILPFLPDKELPGRNHNQGPEPHLYD